MLFLINTKLYIVASCWTVIDIYFTMHCSNNHGQQNFPGLNQEHEQPQLSNEEIRERLLKLERYNWTVTFVWVKAHAGILGNEMTEQISKSAARDEDMTTPFTRIPLSTQFPELEEVCKLKCQQNGMLALREFKQNNSYQTQNTDSNRKLP